MVSRNHKKKALAQARYANGDRMFEADQLRTILEAAPIPLRAMVLLGVNCGYGNHDCDPYRFMRLDLDGGWVSYPRPKTAVRRCCPLWPETIHGYTGIHPRTAKAQR